MKKGAFGEDGRSFLAGTRVYLSGPMDFVASRDSEQKKGWRNRVGEFLREYDVTIFDPWVKPQIRHLQDYGQEGLDTQQIKDNWTFRRGARHAEARAKISGKFYESMHVDLRMVDTSDFVISYCPTNIYSVGTPHEIIMARLQRKPVLFVSPPIFLPSLTRLRDHLEKDPAGAKLLNDLVAEDVIRENPAGIPSLWYMPLVGGENFFDGFGFDRYAKRFGWEYSALDEREGMYRPKNPLLPFLESLSHKQPKNWDNKLKRFVRNNDWLVWDFAGRGGPSRDGRRLGGTRKAARADSPGRRRHR